VVAQRAKALVIRSPKSPRPFAVMSV